MYASCQFTSLILVPLIQFQLRFLLYSLYTRLQAFHVHYECAAAWLGISMSEVHPCDDFLNLLLAFTELGRFYYNIFTIALQSID